LSPLAREFVMKQYKQDKTKTNEENRNSQIMPQFVHITWVLNLKTKLASTKLASNAT
jgi:hypothetical protein